MMRMSACAVFVVLSTMSFAMAQPKVGPYPAKPIRMVAPFPPGGSSDLVARIVAQSLTESWGQQVIVDNRGGAAGNLGTALVARNSPADGYTILLAGVGPIAINQSLYKSVGYDPVRDLIPVTTLVTSPTVLIAHPSVPAKNVQELIALAKAKPGALTCGSGGVGTPAHLGCEMFKLLAKVDVLHVAYKGSGQSINDLLGGQINLVFASTPVGVPHMKTGRVRAYAVTSAQRTHQAPELPTLAEAGVPGYVLDSWWGLLTPARTSQPIVGKLHAESVRLMQTNVVRERLAALGLDPYTMSQREFAELIRSEIAKYGKLIKAAGIQAE
jgi:tripartite-type tricarboxylate transporter receptor subunit TctC